MTVGLGPRNSSQGPNLGPMLTKSYSLTLGPGRVYRAISCDPFLMRVAQKSQPPIIGIETELLASSSSTLRLFEEKSWRFHQPAAANQQPLHMST